MLSYSSFKTLWKQHCASLDSVYYTKTSSLKPKNPPSQAGFICIIQLDYALPSEPNTSIRSSTDAWIAFTPSAKNLRGSKSFFLSYSASFAS